MHKIIIVLSALIAGSCQSPSDYLSVGKDSIDIHIENQTDGDLTNVNVFVVQNILMNGKYQNIRTDSSHIGTIASMKTAKGILNQNNIQHVDGDYLMTATDQTGKRYSQGFGYLTNGTFLEAGHYLIVKKDTVIINRL